MDWGGQRKEGVLHPQGPNILLQIGEKGLGGSCPSHDQGGKITVMVMVVGGCGGGEAGGAVRKVMTTVIIMGLPW